MNEGETTFKTVTIKLGEPILHKLYKPEEIGEIVLPGSDRQLELVVERVVRRVIREEIVNLLFVHKPTDPNYGGGSVEHALGEIVHKEPPT